MSDPNAAGAELLEKVRRELARNRHPAQGPLYRVVEVGRDPDGRLVRHAKIWNSDLNVVRRFGRALAANSVAQQVSIGDAAGATLERIEPAVDQPPPGWQGWRDIPLPPLPRAQPPRPRPAWLAPAAPPPAAPSAPPVAASTPPRDLPVLAAPGPADDPQTTMSRPEPPRDDAADGVAIELP